MLKLVEYEAGGGYRDFRRKMVFKPHNVPVIDINFSEINPLFATAAEDGTVFFFDIRAKFSINNSWIPLKFVRIDAVTDIQIKILHAQLSSASNNNNNNNINNNSNSHDSIILCERISWKSDGDKDIAICSCSDGVIREFEVQGLVKSEEDLSVTVDLHTYETVLPLTERILRVPMAMLSQINSNLQSTASANAPANALNATTKATSVLPSPMNTLSSRDIVASQVISLPSRSLYQPLYQFPTFSSCLA